MANDDKKKKGSSGGSSNPLSGLNQGLATLAKSLGGGTAAATTKETPAQKKTTAQTGLTEAEQSLPVTFSLPGQEIASSVPGATTNPEGALVTTYAGAVRAIYEMDPAQVANAKRELIDTGYLTPTTALNAAITAPVLTAWKKMVLDASNSGVSVGTLLSAGGSAPVVVDAYKAANSALQSAETKYAEQKSGTFTETDPDEIKQALVSAYASIGEAAPSPQLLNAFVDAFHAKEGAGEASEIAQEQNAEGESIKRLGTVQSDLATGDVAGANTVASAPGPLSVVGKATPNLDAEAMAEAKASNPAEYYATQSSYLYGVLNRMLDGSPSYQTSPTAPSQTAPGGAVTGAPLVAVGG